MGWTRWAMLGAVAGTVAVACSDPIGPVPAHPENREYRIPTFVEEGPGRLRWRRDPVEIGNSLVRDDELVVEVTYGGGCREHEFTMVFSDTFLESDPVQSVALLAHDAGGDTCEALIAVTLVADLRALRNLWRRSYQAESGTIVIRTDLDHPGVRYDF